MAALNRALGDLSERHSRGLLRKQQFSNQSKNHIAVKFVELNAKVSSAQLSFHDVDGKFVVRVRDAVVMGEPVDVQPATTQESDSHTNNRNELEIAIC